MNNSTIYRLLFPLIILIMFIFILLFNFNKNNKHDGNDDSFNPCKNVIHGNVPDPCNCKFLYFCVHGNPIKMFCTPGFSYSIELRRCVPHEENDCGERPILRDIENEL
ncbi:ac150 [Hemileuca sp. nucleopolyhedrovirus]|uniref:Ac150 n=1 Tax=Hemileuca sp. nucleopolyhedrovirus TaxID=1367203 RepID=S5MQ65_9ABAC|nr:ac150 [Hemileuca sp. nucleopolyhedrovirus]AGR56813.1 ac150 [Hemileuca sp. nucleopolyhedrovirus]